MDIGKLITGIIASIILVVVGFLVIRGFLPKKHESQKTGQSQIVASPTPSFTARITPTPTGIQSFGGANSTGGIVGNGQPNDTFQNQGNQSQSSSGSSNSQGTQSQSGSGQSQKQTLPNGMTQSQNQ